MIETGHEEEAIGNIFLGVGLTIQEAGTIIGWRQANELVKELTEGTQALKAYSKADFGNCKLAGGQQYLGLIDTALDEVLMGRALVGSTKEPDEVKAREAGLPRNLIQIERGIVVGIHVGPHLSQALAHLEDRLELAR